MVNILLVAFGGAIGACARYGVSAAFFGRGEAWPWPTFIVNVLGSLFIGLLAGWLLTRQETGEPMRLFLGVGVLGGFTTFSAFSLETLRLIERGEHLGALAYVFGSIAAGLFAVAMGAALAKRVFG